MFAKLFSSITESSIWFESDHTRLVWITMLAKADREGYFFASIPGLASLARVPIESAIAALKSLSEPDKWSRTKDHEGRRIEEVDGGWRILNYAKYRDIRDAADRREQNRIAQARRRERLRHVSKMLTRADNQQSQPLRVNSDADSDTIPKGVGGLQIPEKLDTPEFKEAWADWLRYHPKVARLKTPEQTYRSQLKFLAAYDPKTAVEMIQKSIRNAWRGLFEPDTKKGDPNANSKSGNQSRPNRNEGTLNASVDPKSYSKLVR